MSRRLTLALILTLAATVCLRASTTDRNDAASFPDLVEHFKYLKTL